MVTDEKNSCWKRKWQKINATPNRSATEYFTDVKRIKQADGVGDERKGGAISDGFER